MARDGPRHDGPHSLYPLRLVAVVVTTHVVVDGVRNEPVARGDLVEALTPFLDLVGVDLSDFTALHVTAKVIRVRVMVRNKRGRRLPDSWAHVVVRVLDDDVEEP